MVGRASRCPSSAAGGERPGSVQANALRRRYTHRDRDRGGDRALLLTSSTLTHHYHLCTQLQVTMASAFRPLFCSSARSASTATAAPLRSALGRQGAAFRGYATEGGSNPSAAKGSSSNTPLILSVLGVAGLGSWYAMGGFGDGKPGAGGSVGSAAAGALDKNAFKEFVLKEVKPYNHDSST